MGWVGLGYERKFKMVAFFYIVGLVFLVSEEEGTPIECGLAPAPVILPQLVT